MDLIRNDLKTTDYMKVKLSGDLKCCQNVYGKNKKHFLGVILLKIHI